jgi:phosphopantetheinyl transferase (holo-ACP synthase)
MKRDEIGTKIAGEILAVAKLLMAREFATQEALDKYLKEHPDSDASKHSVKKKFQVVNDKNDKDTKKKIKNLKKNVQRIRKEDEPIEVSEDEITKEKLKNLKKNVKRIKEQKVEKLNTSKSRKVMNKKASEILALARAFAGSNY